MSEAMIQILRNKIKVQAMEIDRLRVALSKIEEIIDET